MARVRIQAPTTSAAERTLPIPGTEAPAPNTTTAPALSVREQEIRDVQNAAIAKAQAAAGFTNAIARDAAPPDSERAAIQEEAKEADAKIAELKATLEAKVKADAAKEGDRILAEQKAEREKALGAGFFGPSNPPTNPAKELIKAMEQGLDAVAGEAMKALDSATLKTATPAELDARAVAPTNIANFAAPSVEYVDATWGMEKYNRAGTFSSYEVGPFGGRTAIRPGETRAQAHDRLYEELRVLAHKERERKHAEFVEQFLKVQKG